MAVYPSFDAKDPGSTLDYVWDWQCWMQEDDALVAASFSVDPDEGLVIMSSSTDPATSRALVWLSEGTEGENYLITCRIETSGGRIDERTAFMSISSR